MADNTNVANKILKVLKQISEHLTQDEIIKFRSSISKALELSKEDFNIIKAKEFLRVSVEALQCRPGISVYLLKQSIRSLLMIIYNEALGKDVYERFTEYIVREHPSITIGMELDEELLKAYYKALESGHEYAKHIRLMVVGMYHVGKTTLVHKLLNKSDAEEDHPSTVGIDISVDACEIDEHGKWEITEFKDKEKGYNLRLKELFESNETAKKERQSPHTEKIYDIKKGQELYQTEDVIMESKGNPADEIKSRRTETVFDRCKKELKQEAEALKPSGGTPYYKDIEQANRNALQPNVAIKRPTISIWDFAGQSVYYSTHHFFLNPRAIYLLVLDLSKELNAELEEETHGSGMVNLQLGNSTTIHFTQLDAFQFWMRSIYIYTKQKHSHTGNIPSYTPTIILIGTHKDQVEKENPDTYAEDYFKKALKSVECIPGLKDLICKTKFFFGKGESLDKIEALRSKIYNVAMGQPFWKEKIPGKFIPLERHVVKMKSNKHQTMRFQQLEAVSKDTHFPLDKNEIQVFLKFQHAFGNILHYDKADSDTIILNPQWLIDAFKLFVTQKQSEDLHDLYTYAKLSDRTVDILLKSEGNWIDFKEEILKYMEFLDIIAKPVMFKGHTPDESTAVVTTAQLEVKEALDSIRWQITITTCEPTESEDFHFMPCLLPPRPHAEVIKKQMQMNGGESSPVLCMYIGGVFLPPSIFHRILATCIKKMPVLERDTNYVLYNGLGAFEIDKNTFLTIWSLDNIIYLKVTSCHNNTKDGGKRMPNADLTRVRKYFESLVKELFDIGDHHLSDKFKIAYYITCPDCPEKFPYDSTVDETNCPIDPFVELFEVEEALQTKDMKCNSNTHNVTQTQCLSHWFDTITELKEIDPELSERLLKKPDSLFLADIADEIDPHRIDDLAVRLHILPNQQQLIEKDYGKPTLCYIFHILYTWSVRKRNSVQLFAVAPQLGCSKEDFIRRLDGIDSDRVKADIARLREEISLDKLAGIVLSELHCTQIANDIGGEYWMLGIRLGLDEKCLQRDCLTHSGKSEKIISSILMKWLKKSVLSNKARNEELIRAMVKCDCGIDAIHEIFHK